MFEVEEEVDMVLDADTIVEFKGASASVLVCSVTLDAEKILAC